MNDRNQEIINLRFQVCIKQQKIIQLTQYVDSLLVVLVEFSLQELIKHNKIKSLCGISKY